MPRSSRKQKEASKDLVRPEKELELQLREQQSAVGHEVEHSTVDEEPYEGETSEQDEMESTGHTLKQKLPSARELHRQRRDAARLRNMGVGLSISTDASTSKRRVVFDDDGHYARLEFDKGEEGKTKEQEGSASDVGDSDEDDDDAVEEVRSNVARAKALDQRASERMMAKMQKAHTRSRKRKIAEPDTKSNGKEERDEEFDDEFFAQVDSELETRRMNQQKAKLNEPKGRHTTFVVTADQKAAAEPIHADGNIQLVVLGDNETTGAGAADPKMSSAMGMPRSATSDLFARSRLVSGVDQTQKRGHKKKPDATGWKRSKKTATLMTSRARSHRRKGRGVAAVHFVKP